MTSMRCIDVMRGVILSRHNKLCHDRITPMEKYDAENAKLDVVEVLPLRILLVMVYLLLARGEMPVWGSILLLTTTLLVLPGSDCFPVGFDWGSLRRIGY